jgi:hypothetical protein
MTKTLEWKDASRRSRAEHWPEKLNVWLSESALASLVLAAVQQTDAASLNRVAPMNSGMAYEPRLLLALVTYCYALGIYGSQDVEAMMRADKIFRFLCGGEFPGWQAIRRFRRHNRERIQRCLEETFRLARQMKYPRRMEPLPEHSGERPAEAAFTGASRQASFNTEFLSDMACERIERAMFIDSMIVTD